MAHIVIFTAALAPAPEGDGIVVSGEARCSGMGWGDSPISWSVEVAPNALAATINDAIKDAAIAAAEAREYTVGALDKKTLLAGAVGL